ncbi:uncharacterized protein MEPE_00647 [Melanopsichium pennsylvanicum]|uniref:SDE2-like domain-containing protein n=2 Tax=Melanopsichium pennsylvanicum TaxID=63383 RepID=A0AAJ4XH18_9BASI|nr:conserved hypothetical protein [Melanopsichium pennsylvanicum 4]SNX81942.1 uncharacterized protein MEPE_00647 [Melanopsichium pennsylvanicum]
MISVLVESFDPFPRHLCLSLPASATASNVLDGFSAALSKQSSAQFSITYHGRTIAPSASLGGLISSHDGFPVVLQLRALLPGGKGGFGSMLRSQGGKMSSGGRNSNNDSCRDLNGRRLGVMKQAKKLAEYLEGECERKRQMDESQKKKYAKLEKMLGRAPKTEKDLAEAAEKMADAGQDLDDGSASPEAETSRLNSWASTSASASTPGAAGSKRKERIEDSEYIQQSREIVENVRSAVATAMMKKKKKLNKAKATTSSSTTPATNAHASGSSVAAST